MSLPSIEPDSRRAWIAGLAAAAANGTAFGTAYTFGSFFDSMAEEFGTERGSTALLFGLTLLFFFGFGVVSGPLSDRFGHHRLLAVGGALFVGGLTLTSQVDGLTLGYLTYGLGVGVGSGCFVAPLTALVGQLFVRQRALALGVVAAGNGLGTLVLTPLSARLIEANGWRSTYLTLAIVAAVVFTLSWLAIRVRVPSTTPMSDHPAGLAFLSDRAFRSLFVSGLLMSIGLFVAFAFVGPFARDEGVSAAAAARLVAIIGLSSIAGRLVLTNATNRYGAARVYQFALVLQPIAYVVWLVAGGSYPLLVVFALLLGLAYGGFVAVSPAVMIDAVGLEALGRKMGILFLSFGIGGLVGPPAAGLVADATSGRTTPIAIVIAILVVAVATTSPLTRPASRTSHDAKEPHPC